MFLLITIISFVHGFNYALLAFEDSGSDSCAPSDLLWVGSMNFGGTYLGGGKCSAGLFGSSKLSCETESNGDNNLVIDTWNSNTKCEGKEDVSTSVRINQCSDFGPFSAQMYCNYAVPSHFPHLTFYKPNADGCASSTEVLFEFFFRPNHCLRVDGDGTFYYKMSVPNPSELRIEQHDDAACSNAVNTVTVTLGGCYDSSTRRAGEGLEMDGTFANPFTFDGVGEGNAVDAGVIVAIVFGVVAMIGCVVAMIIGVVVAFFVVRARLNKESVK